MRPRTLLRTAQIITTAAGLTAFGGLGTSVAAASPAPEPTQDEIGVDLPLSRCAPETTTPCADLGLAASNPNAVHQVGADIVRTADGVAGELRDGDPLLAPGKPNRVLGHVFAETTRLYNMTRSRPTIDVRVDPAYDGVLNQRDPESGLLRAKLAPRGPQHEGVSAVDTAVEITAARGYTVGSVDSIVGTAVDTLQAPLGG